MGKNLFTACKMWVYWCIILIYCLRCVIHFLSADHNALGAIISYDVTHLNAWSHGDSVVEVSGFTLVLILKNWPERQVAVLPRFYFVGRKREVRDPRGSYKSLNGGLVIVFPSILRWSSELVLEWARWHQPYRRSAGCLHWSPFIGPRRGYVRWLSKGGLFVRHPSLWPLIPVKWRSVVGGVDLGDLLLCHPVGRDKVLIVTGFIPSTELPRSYLPWRTELPKFGFAPLLVTSIWIVGLNTCFYSFRIFVCLVWLGIDLNLWYWLIYLFIFAVIFSVFCFSRLHFVNKSKYCSSNVTAVPVA